MVGAARRVVLLLASVALLGGCAYVRITSNPPDAQIFYSKTGMEPWKPWPPEASRPSKTPARKLVISDPYYFVRVQKEGYHPVCPEFLDVGWLRRQHVHFDLEPTPELFAQMQRERGLVLYDGRWVRPEEEGLVEYKGRWMRPEEKFKLEQIDKGLVFYKAEQRWVTPEEMRRLEAKLMRKLGFVLFKNRWVRPQEAELEKLIDRQAQRLAATTGTFQLRIERIGPVFTSATQLRVADLTGNQLEVLLSGPQSQRVRVHPYNSVTIQSLPGTYTLVVQPVGRPGGRIGVARVRLAPRTRYSASYRGGPKRRLPIIRPSVPAAPPGPAPGSDRTPVTDRPATTGLPDTIGERPSGKRVSSERDRPVTVPE